MKIRRALLSTLLAALLSGLLGAPLAGTGAGAVAATAPLLEGRVSRVTDGDSLWLEPVPPGAPVQLRLQGIDEGIGSERRRRHVDGAFAKSGRTLTKRFLPVNRRNLTVRSELREHIREPLFRQRHSSRHSA